MKVIEKSAQALIEAVRILEKGGVVICRTDTVYGFLADATNKKAIEKIYKIKKRPKQKPLPIFVKDIKMAKTFAKIDKKQEKILKKHWPGKFTFILKRKPNEIIYGARESTIAIRVPRYEFLNDLLKKINKPLAQTSVNISGEKSLSNIKDIIENFKEENKISLIINGGNIKKAKSSKIVDLREPEIKVLRS